MKRLFVIAFIVALLLPTSFTYSQDKVVKKILAELKKLEFEGFQYEGAEASFELLIQKEELVLVLSLKERLVKCNKLKY